MQPTDYVIFMAIWEKRFTGNQGGNAHASKSRHISTRQQWTDTLNSFEVGLERQSSRS
jgi:hypothetical protein